MPGGRTARERGDDMADKGSSRRAAGQDLEASSPDRIRNVVLVGPAGSGKTTLVETLLAASGAIPRAGSVREGSTVCDFEESEQAHNRSISLAVAPLVHDGTKVNLVDTPGYADFVGELRAGLRAADCALFVVAANEGVDDATRTLWRECADVGMPRAVVITKLDQARADYDGVLRQAQEAFGDKVLPLYVPERSGAEVTALTGLLAPGDGAPEDLRGELIEAVIEESEDETLMDRYVGGEEIAEDVLTADLERAVARATFFPVVPVCSTTGVGCRELLDLAARGFPSPAEHPAPDVFAPSGRATPAISCDPDGPLVAEIVRTTSDPYVGRLSLVRVFSGSLMPDQPVHVSGHFTSFFGDASGHDDHDEDERLGALAHPFGRVAGAGLPDRGRRHRRGRAADPRRDRRHALVGRRPPGAAAVVDARAAAADRDRRAQQGRRGQALPGAGPARRRGPVAADREQRRDPPARAVVHGRDARRGAARAAHLAVRRQRRPGAVHGVAAGDVRRPGQGPRPAREAVRRARPVRGVRHRGGAVARGRRVRVRRQGRRRRRTPPVHPQRREGGARPDGARRPRRLPGRRPAGDAHRRQVAQRRLLRHGLPDRRRARAPRGRGADRPSRCWSRSTPSPSSSPTTWSAA